MDRISFKKSMSYLLRLAELSPELMATFLLEQSYWLPDTPPQTATAAALATGMRDNVRSFSDETLTAIFTICEEAIQNSSDEGNAFATGFLEPLQNAAGRNEFDFTRIASHLGAASKAHCVAIDKFYGVVTPGI
jgi:hypothetical protein